jgi:hypothetical protein
MADRWVPLSWLWARSAEISHENAGAPTRDPGDDGAAGWRSKGSLAVGITSLLADAGHEIPTALLPSFLTSTLGAPAAVLGTIEGVADGLPRAFLPDWPATVAVAFGNLAASSIAGLLWTLLSPAGAFGYAALLSAAALTALLLALRDPSH